MNHCSWNPRIFRVQIIWGIHSMQLVDRAEIGNGLESDLIRIEVILKLNAPLQLVQQSAFF